MSEQIGEREPLKIGFYSPALPDSGASNGVVTYTRHMRDALRALGHSVVVVTVDAIEHADGRIEQIPQPRGLARRIHTLLESRRIQDGSHPAVRLRIRSAFDAARRTGVQVFEMEESFGWAGELAGRGVALVERLHGPHYFVRDEIESAEETRRGNLRQTAEFRSFGKVQAVTAPTQRLLDALVWHGLDAALARAIPNPMQVVPQALTWRAESANANQILFVGRFDLCKGADLAIRAFADAVVRRPALRLVMVGRDEGLAQSDGARLRFEEFVAREVPLSVRERINFLGEQPPAHIRELRLQSGFGLISSRFETSSYALTEAMALGMPVLASDCVGPSELIQDAKNGRLVPVGDVVAMANAMIELASRPELLRNMGQTAYSWVADRLAPCRIASEMVEVYREAIRRC